MTKKSHLIMALVIALVLSGGVYAYTHTTASVTIGVTVAEGDIATVEPAPAGDQPDWNSLMPSAGTEILRPNNSGDQTVIANQTPSSGAHWDKVDEETADGDTTRVYTNSETWQEDLYNITNHSVGTGDINYVRVYIVCQVDSIGQTSAYVHIKTNGVMYNGSEETVTTSYATYSYQWDTNPQTGYAWTWAEVDALQIGVGLRSPVRPRNTYCTQVYAEVSYGKSKGNVCTGDLFTIAPNPNYTGDLAVNVYLVNTGNLIKAYQYLNLKLYLEGSVEAGETPNFRLLTLSNGMASFTLSGPAPGSHTLSVIGGSYAMISDTSSGWESGWTLTPEFYCEATQR